MLMLGTKVMLMLTSVTDVNVSWSIYISKCKDVNVS